MCLLGALFAAFFLGVSDNNFWNVKCQGPSLLTSLFHLQGCIVKFLSSLFVPTGLAGINDLDTQLT